MQIDFNPQPPPEPDDVIQQARDRVTGQRANAIAQIQQRQRMRDRQTPATFYGGYSNGQHWVRHPGSDVLYPAAGVITNGAIAPGQSVIPGRGAGGLYINQMPRPRRVVVEQPEPVIELQPWLIEYVGMTPGDSDLVLGNFVFGANNGVESGLEGVYFGMMALSVIDAPLGGTFSVGYSATPPSSKPDGPLRSTTISVIFYEISSGITPVITSIGDFLDQYVIPEIQADSVWQSIQSSNPPAANLSDRAVLFRWAANVDILDERGLIQYRQFDLGASGRDVAAPTVGGQFELADESIVETGALDFSIPTNYLVTGTGFAFPRTGGVTTVPRESRFSLEPNSKYIVLLRVERDNSNADFTPGLGADTIQTYETEWTMSVNITLNES